MKTRWFIVPVFAGLHFALTWIAWFMSFAALGRQWDDGTALSVGELFVTDLADRLQSPMAWIGNWLGSDLLTAALTPANSLIWGIGLYALVEFYRRVDERARATEISEE